MIGIDWLIKKIESRYDVGTFLNRHFNRYFVIDRDVFKGVISRTGEQYYIHPNICTVKEVYDQYSFYDMRPDDIVIDIGANVGAFSLMASNSRKIVHAYEPILYHELCRNIDLNDEGYYDVWVFPHYEGLGSGYQNLVYWEGEEYIINTKTLTQMKEECGGCDFLKCDCEGAEWGITIDELKSIRRIEIEFHFGCHATPRPELIDEIKEYFDVTIRKEDKTWWVSGVNEWIK